MNYLSKHDIQCILKFGIWKHKLIDKSSQLKYFWIENEPECCLFGKKIMGSHKSWRLCVDFAKELFSFNIDLDWFNIVFWHFMLNLKMSHSFPTTTKNFQT